MTVVTGRQRGTSETDRRTAERAGVVAPATGAWLVTVPGVIPGAGTWTRVVCSPRARSWAWASVASSPISSGTSTGGRAAARAGAA